LPSFPYTCPVPGPVSLRPASLGPGYFGPPRLGLRAPRATTAHSRRPAPPGATASRIAAARLPACWARAGDKAAPRPGRPRRWAWPLPARRWPGRQNCGASQAPRSPAGPRRCGTAPWPAALPGVSSVGPAPQRPPPGRETSPSASGWRAGHLSARPRHPTFPALRHPWPTFAQKRRAGAPTTAWLHDITPLDESEAAGEKNYLLRPGVVWGRAGLFSDWSARSAAEQGWRLAGPGHCAKPPPRRKPACFAGPNRRPAASTSPADSGVGP
jgi:hypothetical protein